ncbi:MAG: ATP-binding cassette domain-containing protein, partial [Paracoccaceae bacterium]
MLLNVRNVGKSFDSGGRRVAVFSGVSFHVAAGDAVALTGESGSGKSTLLHLCAGLDRPDQGEVALEGQDMAALGDKVRAALRRRLVGLVFQQFNLIPSLDVAANLAFQARIAGREDAAWTAELARRLGLETLLDRYPEQLSG